MHYDSLSLAKVLDADRIAGISYIRKQYALGTLAVLAAFAECKTSVARSTGEVKGGAAASASRTTLAEQSGFPLSSTTLPLYVCAVVVSETTNDNMVTKKYLTLFINL